MRLDSVSDRERRSFGLDRFELSPTRVWLVGGLLLWALYAGAFLITGTSTLARAPVDALANALPLVLAASVTHVVLRTHVLTLSPLRQVIAHGLAAPVFAFGWYAMIGMLLGFLTGVRGGSFAPQGFSGPAATWQMFQGLILYALVAAVCYALRGGGQAAEVQMVTPAPAFIERYLLRDAEGIRPVDVRRIATITGAQDYSEVATDEGSHLIRLSLNEFEGLLDPARFVRIHRSAIINLDLLRVAENAGGGRMVAVMRDGTEVPVSRAGAALLRARIL